MRVRVRVGGLDGVREGGLVTVAAAEVGSHPRLGELARRRAVVPG